MEEPDFDNDANEEREQKRNTAILFFMREILPDDEILKNK